MTVFDDDSLKMQNILEQKTDKTLKVKVMAWACTLHVLLINGSVNIDERCLSSLSLIMK